MRLSDVLSKPITTDYVQIENFLGSRKLKTGNSKKIAVGKVALNYSNKSSRKRYGGIAKQTEAASSSLRL